MLLLFINSDELFHAIRYEPEFQQIVSDLEANTKQSMNGSGSGWRRMIVSLPKYKSKMKTRDYRDIYSGKSSICCA